MSDVGPVVAKEIELVELAIDREILTEENTINPVYTNGHYRGFIGPFPNPVGDSVLVANGQYVKNDVDIVGASLPASRTTKKGQYVKPAVIARGRIRATLINCVIIEVTKLRGTTTINNIGSKFSEEPGYENTRVVNSNLINYYHASNPATHSRNIISRPFEDLFGYGDFISGLSHVDATRMKLQLLDFAIKWIRSQHSRSRSRSPVKGGGKCYKKRTNKRCRRRSNRFGSGGSRSKRVNRRRMSKKK